MSDVLQADGWCARLRGTIDAGKVSMYELCAEPYVSLGVATTHRHIAPHVVSAVKAYEQGIKIRRAADALANGFAWSSVTADTGQARAYLQILLDELRAALSQQP